MPFGHYNGFISSFHIAFPKLIDNNPDNNYAKDVITIKLIKDGIFVKKPEWE